jgi:DNA-directed RNA polymerase specialized sigma24 family protein
MSAPSSFAGLMDRLRARDPAAAEQVFRRFTARLLALAQSRLDPLLRRRLDPEDVVQSVLKSFFLRQAEGRWELGGWDGLWALLAAITVRKCARQAEQARAACRDVHREAGPGGGDGWDGPSAEPTPEEAVALVELVEELLQGVGERDRHIVALTLQGETPGRIAEQVGCSERKVYRIQEGLRQHLERLRDATG